MYHPALRLESDSWLIQRENSGERTQPFPDESKAKKFKPKSNAGGQLHTISEEEALALQLD
jgi:hypothetical protein